MDGKRKMNFFKRVKKSICNLEEYILFATEKFSVGLKYFFTLLLFFSIIISIAFAYRFYNIKNDVTNYIKNDLPDFEIKDNILQMNTTEIINIEDKNGVYSVIINNINNDANTLKTGNGIIFLKDKLIIKIPNLNLEQQEYSYESILNQLNTSSLSKQQI